MTGNYGEAYYRALDSGCQSSAAAVVPEVVAALRPRSVLDVGCGTGAWLAEFLRAGVADVLGVDGPWLPRGLLRIPADRFHAQDLTAPLALPQEFDLTVCLEVAEHLPGRAAEGLVGSLAALAPVAMFSAAVPGQGGEGHVNERPPEYWDGLFAERGMRPARGFGAKFVGHPGVRWWYARNLVFYVRAGSNLPAALGQADSRPLPGRPEGGGAGAPERRP
jgi:SAM-dependent methyltransferase